MLLNRILENLKNKDKVIAYKNLTGSYTYKELYKYVKNIYKYMIDNNIYEKRIIVYGHKDISMLAAFLGCSFSGNTYIPIDSSIPRDRLDFIINEANPVMFINTTENKLEISAENMEYMNKEKLQNIMESRECDIDIITLLKENDVYYIIYTSGTTGKPKGVQITYSNLDSFINWHTDVIGVAEGKVLNQANFSFDLSVADIYLSLVLGLEEIVLESNIQKDFPALMSFVKENNPDVIVMTPSFAEKLLLDNEFNGEKLNNLKKIYFCGETLQKITAQKLLDRFKENKLRIINAYGPTECTVAVTSIEINESIIENCERLNKTLPIGKVKRDCQIKIVDENRNEIFEGELGEILIVGKSVSNRYVDSSNIKNNNFIKWNNEKAYLTGDIGYIEEDILYYKDRKDNQIKYSGYRIEKSDIENNLYRLDYIEKAAIVTKENEEGKVTKIIAFVTVKESIDSITIRNDLKKYLPDYMIPVVKIIDEMPLNNNGKCDINKLKEIASGR